MRPVPDPVDSVHFILPGDVDDPGSVSGGNAYDRRMCDELRAAGTAVHETAVPGAWPRPPENGPGRAELARALGELPDGEVVLVDGLVACGVPELIEPHAGRLRLAVLVHLPLADETGLGPAEAAESEKLERRTLHAAAAVIATSDWAARDVAARHGLPPSRVHTVLPGTDPAPLARGTDGASRLLCVAALTPRKGQDLLVDALAGLDEGPDGDLNHGPEWRCDLTGPVDRSPEYVQRLRARIDELGLGERVRITGPKTGEALHAAYDAADLFVLASRTETYGMVLTEALARGLPVLAADAGAVRSTVGTTPDGSIPGVLVPPGDSAALTAALRRWLTDPGIRSHLTTSAHESRAALQGWAESSRQLAGVLRRLRPE